jgi:hypothetical protein
VACWRRMPGRCSSRLQQPTPALENLIQRCNPQANPSRQGPGGQRQLPPKPVATTPVPERRCGQLAILDGRRFASQMASQSVNLARTNWVGWIALAVLLERFYLENRR